MHFASANITEASSFREVDEALYAHETPFYRAAAGGQHFTRTPEWNAERERLYSLWREKHNQNAIVVRRSPSKQSVLQRLLNMLGND